MMRDYIVHIFHALLVLFFIVGFNSAVENEEMKCKERERHALLKFKQGLQDEHGMLSTWKDDTNADCCKWTGVRCNNQTGYVQRLYLQGTITRYLSGEIGSSIIQLEHLEYLDLSYSFIRGHIPKFIGSFSNLQYLDLSRNELTGAIPFQLGNLSRLQHLDLGGNELVEAIPFQLGNLSQLQHLDLSYNELIGAIPSQLQNLSLLQELWLSYNEISGMLPDLSVLSSLRELMLDNNKLIGEIPTGIGSLTKLEYLYLGSNFSKLLGLHLSSNLLTVKVSTDWVPPFQLIYLFLESCNLNSTFPNWVLNQNHLLNLDISNNNITDEVPNLELKFTKSPEINLSSNQLEGSIPSFLFQAVALRLSHNKFSDLASFLCNNGKPNNLAMLDLSNNQLKGELPDCWNNLTSLKFVELSNNKLLGKIPISMGALVNMEALILRNNRLSGPLPSSLKNCSNKLALLDLGENMFHGPIPSWIGDSLHQLIILSLRFNNFNESLPSSLCYLRELKVLDLSLNSLSGGIPTCVKNFTSMARDPMNSTSLIDHEYILDTVDNMNITVSYEFHLFLMWKGVDRLYENVDKFLKSIDLSSNHLIGQIPTEIEYLLGLTSLNLSRNNLSGEIISDIGKFKSLEFLDLSRNHLSGRIPSSLAHIDRLSVLNLSNNQLYGKIPIGTQLQTFSASSFEGNPNLCGEPLDIKCPGEEEPPKHQVPITDAGDDNSVFLEALYMSMGLGFFTTFVGFIGSLLLLPSWRETYSKFLNALILKVFFWWKQ